MGRRLSRKFNALLATVIVAVSLAGCKADTNPNNYQVISEESSKAPSEPAVEQTQESMVSEQENSSNIDQKEEKEIDTAWEEFTTTISIGESGFTTNQAMFLSTPKASYRFGDIESGTGFELVEYGWSEGNNPSGYMVLRIDGLQVRVYPIEGLPVQQGLKNSGGVYYHEVGQLTGNLRKFYAYVQGNSYWLTFEVECGDEFDQEIAVKAVKEASTYFTINSSLSGLYNKPRLKVKIGDYTYCAALGDLPDSGVVVNYDTGELSISSSDDSIIISLFGEKSGYEELDGYSGIYYTSFGSAEFCDRMLNSERFCAC